MIDGQCLCGAVKFSVSGELGSTRLCYCQNCRRANGTAFSANVRIPIASYTLLSGRDVIREYESSPGAFRAFCSVCGSPVFAKVASDAQFIRVRLGTLNQHAKANVTAHVWVDSKPDWYAVEGRLPQHRQGAGPPSAQ